MSIKQSLIEDSDYLLSKSRIKRHDHLNGYLFSKRCVSSIRYEDINGIRNWYPRQSIKELRCDLDKKAVRNWDY